MARDIDDIIKVVKEHSNISPIHKQLLINRIEKEPTPEEIAKAKEEVYGEQPLY